jgi:hypothetical protein
VKELKATATRSVDATPERCVELLAAVDRYPAWHPELIPQAEALERDVAGLPTRARAVVHLAAGPLVKDLELVVSVAIQPGRAVTLSRIPNELSDPERFNLTWEIELGAETSLTLVLDARVDVPRILPVGGIGDAVAQGFIEAARRALDASSPNASASSS